MKTEIFKTAIKNRNRLKFLYGLDEFLIEPYYIMTDKNGNKVIYGKISGSSEIRKFAYNKIANIKVLEKRKFSPIIPIIPMAS
ncbi:MAG TPA: hypothetical protein PK073_06845 [Ignavibacteriaceae bacterium]|jgi:hypothetical protein|nr:MAG: hypothetical protein BWY38_02163 [Ignavibacteria bacterium ADurb.Bin266]OQY73347.1 MAG: hypothetical protein B6D44_07430 [Ignavibacteriales bacterium UTCHB2]HQF42614.1 hypothetical protein [Ignavibacteriaceae bacterium]HQI41170.1 hypothetical protein [Ignavibacteriaceae bacterium]HQJ46534.1 hypothetical protein [Ignavibacteriaceae bacterium]